MVKFVYMANNSNKFIPVESIFKMKYLEQFVNVVRQYSSRYNDKNSYSYAPQNLIGKYMRYPAYGDFIETYIFRSYGKWWKETGAAQIEYRPQDFDLLGAEDFVVVEFDTPVVPREIFIYEVYNPGAVVRIWGSKSVSASSTINTKWYLLWEGFPQKCAPRSRKFSPPLKKVNILINLLKIEFNQSHLEYYTAIDAILLSGYQPFSNVTHGIISHNLVKFDKFDDDDAEKVNYYSSNSRFSNDKRKSKISEQQDYFLTLPNEIILKIFHYLDLKSLSRCAQVNGRWNKLSNDQALYQNINLKIYWNLVDYKTLNYFYDRMNNTKKLDLSWCNQDKIFFNEKRKSNDRMNIERILVKVSKTLTHLSMNDNYFVDYHLINNLVLCKELVDLRLRNTFNWIRLDIKNYITKLVSLDLSMTKILDEDLIKILIANPNLEHLVLDLCERIFRMDNIVETVSIYNKKLKTWSSWKSLSITNVGVNKFSSCSNLEELDLGWCLLRQVPGDCLNEIAAGCKGLKRLILSKWQGINDQLLSPIIYSCQELTQLDLLGIKNITSEIIEKALYSLPKLKLLDISFCDSIRQEEIEIWRQKYPHVKIQRSCMYAEQ